MKNLVDGYESVTINRERVGIPASLVTSNHRGGVQQMIDCFTGLGVREQRVCQQQLPAVHRHASPDRVLRDLYAAPGCAGAPMTTVRDKENVHETLIPFFQQHPALDGVIMVNSNNITDIKRALAVEDAARKRKDVFESPNAEKRPFDTL